MSVRASPSHRFVVASVLVLSAACGRTRPTKGPEQAKPTDPHDDVGDERARAGLERMCGAATSDPEVRELLGKACRNGDGEGCVKLGRLFLCGAGVERNAKVGISFFEKACALGHGLGCHTTAVVYEHGIGMPRDETRARTLLESTCAKGIAMSCEGLGIMLLERDDHATRMRALALLDSACSKDEGDACGQLGLIAAGGLYGQPKDETRAFEKSKRGCDLKSVSSCAAVGALYVLGIGTPKEEALGAQLLTAACTVGAGRACYNLAICYLRGVGVPEDDAKGLETMRRACDLGEGEACRTVADSLGAGRSGPKVSPGAAPGHF